MGKREILGMVRLLAPSQAQGVSGFARQMEDVILAKLYRYLKSFTSFWFLHLRASASPW
jgi:hypothetical protein